jgi:hypothetical protein
MNAVAGLNDTFARIGLTILRGAGPDCRTGLNTKHAANRWERIPIKWMTAAEHVSHRPSASSEEADGQASSYP